MTKAKYQNWIRTRPYERTKERAKHQCPCCIATIQEGRMARHILSKHPEDKASFNQIPIKKEAKE
jgi:hypothetical protein